MTPDLDAILAAARERARVGDYPPPGFGGKSNRATILELVAVIEELMKDRVES